MGDERGFCIRSIRYRIPNIEPTPLENFDFSDALESVYPLLEIIFEFLNYNDLKTCCKVKPTWKEVAENILNKRNTPSWFSCYSSKISSSTIKPKIISHSDNLNYNNVGIGIILYDFRRIKLNNYICIHHFNYDMELSRKTVPEYIEEELVPHNVNYCLLSCPKFASCFDAIKKEDGSYSILDGLFLPKIPKIRTAMFHCNPLKKDLSKYLKTQINPNEEVKCLLLFCTKSLNNSIYNLLRILIPENNASSVAVGGGVIRGTKTFQQITPAKKIFSSNDTFCIVFLQEQCSEPEFNAFSFVIYGDDLSKEEFEEELLKFKKQIILRTNSAAFRVCCSAKIYSEEELVLFNKVFPNIPLMGMNADGEIGWNCFYTPQKTNEGGSEAKKLRHKYPKVQHQWSTILVLITWGPLRSK